MPGETKLVSSAKPESNFPAIEMTLSIYLCLKSGFSIDWDSRFWTTYSKILLLREKQWYDKDEYTCCKISLMIGCLW